MSTRFIIKFRFDIHLYNHFKHCRTVKWENCQPTNGNGTLNWFFVVFATSILVVCVCVLHMWIKDVSEWIYRIFDQVQPNTINVRLTFYVKSNVCTCNKFWMRMSKSMRNRFKCFRCTMDILCTLHLWTVELTHDLRYNWHMQFM